jgi:mannose-6-phosphate isomerase-like protein (cupin superfamily)
MIRVQKDKILERLLFSDGVAEAYARPEKEETELGSDHWSDHWTRPVLLERVAYLRKRARFSEGSVCETIREFSGYSVMLSVLLRSGDAVVLEDISVILIVLDGHATLVIGGALEHSKRVGPGEIRGTAISGGSSRELRAGDLVHVAAGTPHQLLLAGDKTISCLVVRVKDIREG